MYNVIVLAEQAMTAGDAAEVVSLHEGIEDARHYHVLIPCDNARVRVESALGSLAASETLVAPVVVGADIDTEEEQQRLNSEAQSAVATSVSALKALGHEADGEYSSDDPIDSLNDVVAKESADEVIIMTRPHVIQEFLHLDWTSKARRRLGVPVLHLVEHETLDAEAANGQGITGA
ncbi:MAG: hypothetical protein H0V07_08250 [Propionibacteriales bacterium]|nr:hypothetical protein [Propionibacteriales bacterium]